MSPKRFGSDYNGGARMPLALSIWLLAIIVAGMSAWTDMRANLVTIRTRITHLGAIGEQQHSYTGAEIDAMRELLSTRLSQVENGLSPPQRHGSRDSTRRAPATGPGR